MSSPDPRALDRSDSDYVPSHKKPMKKIKSLILEKARTIGIHPKKHEEKKFVKEAENKYRGHIVGEAELMRKKNPNLGESDSERAAKWKAYGEYIKRKHNR